VFLTGRADRAPPPRQTAFNWIEHIHETTLAQDWQLKIEVLGSEHIIRAAIQNGKALAVSDGSFQDHRGACAWIIESENSDNRIMGQMIVPGNQGDHSSFRSEAAGIYGLLLTVWYLLKDKPVQGTLMVACDGKSVLDRL